MLTLALVLSEAVIAIVAVIFIAIVAVALFRKRKPAQNNSQGGGGNYGTPKNRDDKFKNDLEN